MGWGALAADVPLDGAQPPAQPQTAAPAPSEPSSAPEASTGFVPLPADAQLDDAPADAPPPQDHSATNDEMRRMFHAGKSTQEIVDYGVHHGLQPNHDQIEHARANGMDVQFVQPENKSAAPTHTDIRSAIGEGIIDSLDTFFPGVGTLIRGNRDAGKAFTEHVANAAGGDYGPEIGGFLDTAASPSQWGDFGSNLDKNVAVERNQLATDSQGHPVASVAGELTGAGLTAPLAGQALKGVKVIDAAAQAAPKIISAAKSAVGGAIYGSGAAGPDNRAAGAVTGAALGAATDVAAPYVIKAIPAIGNAISNAASRAPSATPEAIAAAKAAQELNITLPKFALSDADRAQAGALEQTAAGRGPIKAGRNAMLDTSEAARNDIAGSVGNTPETAAQLGDQTLDAAVKSNKTRRNAIGTLYDYASSASAGSLVRPAQTVSTIDSLLSDEGSKIGGSKIAPVLQNIKDDLAQAGSITVDQARNLRTTLREQLTNEAGSTPSNADRITNQVMSAVNADMRNSLPGDAFNIYKQADTAWAQQRSLEDDVLKPFLGKDFDNWGDQVAAKINSDAKGNGLRLARFLGSLPAAEANNVRASLISGLGKSRDGAQNAEGNAFSLNTFLTNWNQLSGARKLIFAPDTVNALDKLADVANVGKLSEAARNHPNTGGVISRLLMGAGEFGGGAAILTGHVKEGVMGLLASGLMAAKQYGAAKLLANPDFAKRLASTPINPKGAVAFWSRPWAEAMTAKNPAIAGEIQLFQRAVNDNLRQMPAAASNPNGPGQNQKADGTQP